MQGPDTSSQLFPVLLQDDVVVIHEDGFSLDLEPKRVPALAELASALEAGQAQNESLAVKHALTKAIGRVADNFVRLLDTSHKEIGKGLAALLGLPEAAPTGLEDRRLIAAPFLLGPGKDNHALRRCERGKVRLTNLIVKQMTEQLIALGGEVNFVFEGRLLTTAPLDILASSPPQVDAIDTTLLSAALVDLAATPYFPIRIPHPAERDLARGFRQELHLYCEQGDAADTPALNSLARFALPNNDGYADSDLLRTLLRRVIDSVKDHNYKQVLVELLGVGQDPISSYWQRSERAMAILNRESWEVFATQHWLLNELVRKLLEVAIRLQVVRV